MMKIFIMAALAITLAACSDSAKTPLASKGESTPNTEPTPITSDYVAIHAAETQKSLIADALQNFFFDEDLKGVWLPDPDLTRSQNLDGINTALNAQCESEIKLEKFNGHFKIHKAYDQEISANSLFQGYQSCIRSNLPNQKIPQEWVRDISQFHIFTAKRKSADVVAITGEKFSKKRNQQIDISKKPLEKDFTFQEFKELLLVLAKEAED